MFIKYGKKDFFQLIKKYRDFSSTGDEEEEIDNPYYLRNGNGQKKKRGLPSLAKVKTSDRILGQSQPTRAIPIYVWK